MSQNQDEMYQDAQANEELDAGFDIDLENENQPANAKPSESEATTNDVQPEANQPESNTEPVQTDGQPAQEQLLSDAPYAPQVAEQPHPESPKMLEAVPENIAAEIEELKRLNPKAAELAMEDSAEGEAIRRRLENYGAEQAQDRAEMVLDKREAENERAKAQYAAKEAYNRRFMETIRSQNPEYFSLITDPARKTEAVQYFSSIKDWIESKPFREAQPLLQIAQKGDAHQVLQLVSRFENEKKGQKKADPTGALAVPGRGAPIAPAGVGDKDDLDAGWNLNRD